jgi:glycerol-3-phosphate cytidylyltransferase
MPKIKTSHGIIKYKTYPLYLGIKKIDKLKSKENLFLLKKVCEKHKLFFGLIAGTLLGAIRENDFIDHDEDIDIFFLEEDKMRFFDILQELIDNNFKIARYDRRGLLSIIRNNEYIDIYFFSKYIANIRICSGWCVPEKYLLDTAFIDFQGAEFLAPKSYRSYLKFEYGETWKTPIAYTDFNVNKVKVLLFILKEKIKDILPNCMYFELARITERKMEKKYLSKAIADL